MNTSVSAGTIISIETTFDWQRVYCPCGRRLPDLQSPSTMRPTCPKCGATFVVKV